ncbi:MAG: glutathione S-transferase family protein [Pseudomonadota bacterium]
MIARECRNRKSRVDEPIEEVFVSAKLSHVQASSFSIQFMKGTTQMTDYVLYGYPESGSASVELALLEAGIPFRMKDINPDDLQGEAFLAINPRGQVPAMVHPDGSVITEVPAILLHMADAHPRSGLAPESGSSARAQHDRWLAFVHANCYEAVLRLFYSERYTTDPAAGPAVREAALRYLIAQFNILADATDPDPFILGETPRAVDFLVWVITTWLVEEDTSALDPRITRLKDAVAARPSLAEAVARHT